VIAPAHVVNRGDGDQAQVGDGHGEGDVANQSAT
jgi:hypothetical protein